MDIELHIEELVLHGFAPADRHRIGEAVSLELKRLLTEANPQRLLGRSVDSEHIDAEGFRVRPNASLEMLGAQVGQAIYRGLGS